MKMVKRYIALHLLIEAGDIPNACYLALYDIEQIANKGGNKWLESSMI